MSPAASSSLRTLLTGPAGSGKTHAALERVRDAATRRGDRGRLARRPGEALLVLPTYAQAMHLARGALARWDARAVLDDPFATFTSAGERYLDGFLVRALPSAVERDALMAEALRRADPACFRGVGSAPSFRSRLLRLVKEAKQSGEEGDRLRAHLAAGLEGLEEDARERLRAFLDVFAVYDELLRAADLEDHEDTLRRLAASLGATPPARAPGLLVVDGFDDFTPVEMAILDTLSDHVVARGGEVLVTLPWDEGRPELFAASRPPREHLLGRGFVEEKLQGFRRRPGTSLERLALGLFAPAETSPVPSDGSVQRILAGDDEDEAEAVARLARHLHDEVGLLRGWRDLGVVVRRPDSAASRLLAAFDRMKIPARLVVGGESLASEAIVRALDGPLRVLAGTTGGATFDPAGLLPWLRWTATATGDAGALGLVDRMEIRWRREGWPFDLAAFLADAAAALPAAAELSRLGGELARERDWPGVEAVLAQAIRRLAPLPPSGGLDADGRPQDAGADRRLRRAAAARTRVLDLLAELARASGRTGLGAPIDPPQAVASLLDAVEHAAFAPRDRRLDVVNVLDFEEARYWELPVVVVCGLAQGQVPLLAREDLLLGDEDRRGLRAAEGLALPLTRDLQTRERRLFYGALTRATRRLVLVRSAFDADGGPRAPSLYLREVERVLDLARVTTARPPGRAAPVETECFTPGDWTLFAARHARSDDAPRRDLARHLLALEAPSLARRAARWRMAGGDPLDPSHAGRIDDALAVVSAGACGHGLACRHRLFLKQVVGLPEDDAPFSGPGFQARERGTMVHEALRGALADRNRDADEVARDTIAWAARRSPREVGRLGEVDRRLLALELGRVVRLLRHREDAAAGALAPDLSALELAFGDDGGLDLGRGLRLRGRIDRVDRDGPAAAIVDYKLSREGAKRAYDAFREGLDVQLPLYALAVERLLDVGVVGFTWMAATTRARFALWDEQAAARAGGGGEGGRFDVDPGFARQKLAALERAAGVVEALRAGDHARQVEDGKRCGRCAWRAVCRPAYRSADADPDGGEDAA